jgi:hypothetical protein
LVYLIILFKPFGLLGYPVYALWLTWLSCLCPLAYLAILFRPFGLLGYHV